MGKEGDDDGNAFYTAKGKIPRPRKEKEEEEDAIRPTQAIVQVNGTREMMMVVVED